MPEDFDLDIAKQWTPFEDLMPFGAVATQVVQLLPFLSDPVFSIAPSVQLSPSGPIVESLIVLTGRTIARVYQVDDKLYDFVSRSGFGRMRWRVHELGQNEPGGPTIYAAATLELHYQGIPGYQVFAFVGNEPSRDRWVQQMRTAIDPGLLGR